MAARLPVQAMVQMDRRPSRLWLVTRSAQPVGELVEAVNPPGAVVGLGK